MSDHKKIFSDDNQKLNKISSDLLGHIRINGSFLAWIAFLHILLLVCVGFYVYQLKNGLGVTGLRDYVSWGLYIAHFVFFVAASLIGMLISSVLGLIGYQWIKPIGRIAEIIAVAFSAVAGLVIVSDMGRPDRLPYVFMYGRVQSPILWDVTVVTTYMVISLLLYFLPLIPDLAIAKTRLQHAPKWLSKVYEFLSLNWNHSSKQYDILLKSMRILLILIIPTAFAIHTVTSWLFAVTPRAGWNSTIFGPYFITGAFVTGVAGVVILMYFFRKNYKLGNYLTDMHFDKMGKLLVLVSLVYLYFNINEFLVPAYKMEKAEAVHIKELFVGEHALLFWGTQLSGLILPIILLLFRKMRKPLPMLIISIFVFMASWTKRYIIVVPTQEHPFLPKMYVPEKWMHYVPTAPEVFITLGTFVLAVLIITGLSKFFPVIPIWEMAEEAEKKEIKEIKE
ncbi:NrfD/PsrC family molybdoenzyme membrane anchor subunit [Saccharicrinis sp. FJH54]|uniref:NrfD/PsrC family molybdoenzyme membrane anchor subunit n=1 Tax=Saccharicrinis sp. FJH54 TaxID=3344665 RepID=UPI0035D51B30